MEKMTNAKALNYVIENCELPTEIMEKLQKMKEQVEKKNSKERKPTATQVENVGLKDAILAYLETCESGVTIGDIMKNCDAVADLSNQRVSALVRQLKDDGLVNREEIKRKAYFSIAPIDED
jgi:DNA-binding transcriptional regulator GbsR (MarR family)